MSERVVWALRVLWFLLPLTLGPVIGDALSSAGNGVPRVATLGLWVLWALGVVASMIPLPQTLTALRIATPAVALLAIWALLDLNGDPKFSVGGLAVVAAVHAIGVAAVAMNQIIGDRFADGASYGDERRLLLRPPTVLGYVLAPIVGALVAAGLVAGPLLLANRSWVPGIVALAIGLAVAAAGIRALHQLTQRWIIFVPTGMVLHDMMVLTEPVLFRRTAIERLGPAIAGTPARDLSNNAAGLLLECELTDPAPLGLRDPAGPTAATLTDVRRYLFCPTRPGALLDEAEARNIAVG